LQALRCLQTGDFSARALKPYADRARRRYLADHRAAQFLRTVLAHPRMVNRLVKKAQADRSFALAVGLAIIGVTSCRDLLRPHNLAHYLI
jgi:hypothetical protein